MVTAVCTLEDFKGKNCKIFPSNYCIKSVLSMVLQHLPQKEKKKLKKRHDCDGVAVT